MKVRFDFIFSNWIFLWYLLYIINNRKSLPNPKFVLLLALLHNIIIILLMIKLKVKTPIIILLIIGAFILKIIPLYSILDTNIQLSDVNATLILLLIYFYWLHLHNIHHSTYLYNQNVIIETNKKFLGNIYNNIINLLYFYKN